MFSNLIVGKASRQPQAQHRPTQSRIHTDYQNEANLTAAQSHNSSSVSSAESPQRLALNPLYCQALVEDIELIHCKVCRKGFKFKSQLQIHERSHTGSKPYHCEICNTSFSQVNNLYRHMRRLSHFKVPL